MPSRQPAKKKTSARKKSRARTTSKTSAKLHGSCQCGKITFAVDSETPVPFMFCFCSICRKTGGGPFGVNVMGIAKTLKVKGKPRFYHAKIREKGKPTKTSEAKRWFCADCGTHLYLTDERWPTGIWPYVSAIDSDLPVPEEPISIMTLFKPSWVPAWMTEHGPTHPRYPETSVADWHEREGYTVTVKP
jgi:hypothetical protein